MHTLHSRMFTAERVASPRKPLRLEEPRDDFIPTPQDRRSSPHPGDRLLSTNEEPPLGAHLVTPRFAYAHHGVYVGGGTVVHYAAFAKLWHRGPVEETPLARFADGHPVSVRPARCNQRQCAEIVQRARSRLGEDRYRFLSNNCEHLSEWCVNGEHRSPQVEQLFARLRKVSRALTALRRYLEVGPARRDAAPHPIQ